MIVPGKKPYKMPKMVWLMRVFFKFIDANGIVLEFDRDYPAAIKLFAESVEYHLLIELGEDDA